MHSNDLKNRLFKNHWYIINGNTAYVNMIPSESVDHFERERATKMDGIEEERIPFSFCNVTFWALAPVK
jgi:hypothetical protein